MPGNTPDLQISNGCRYVLAAQNALAPVVPATAASAKRALPKKKPRRKRAKIARARPRRS